MKQPPPENVPRASYYAALQQWGYICRVRISRRQKLWGRGVVGSSPLTLKVAYFEQKIFPVETGVKTKLCCIQNVYSIGDERIYQLNSAQPIR